MIFKKVRQRRFDKTLSFIEKVLPNKTLTIVDLGQPNDLASLIKQRGYNITNTTVKDFDFEPKALEGSTAEVVTAFEIIEHLLSPFPLLLNLPGETLIATVPLKLWFAKSYRNKNDEYDMHYHEFEDWQFDWLLKKAGWQVVYSEKWILPTGQLGIRPLLRFFYPRIYAVHAIRIH